jgi:hypothetical protein
MNIRVQVLQNIFGQVLLSQIILRKKNFEQGKGKEKVEQI